MELVIQLVLLFYMGVKFWAKEIWSSGEMEKSGQMNFLLLESNEI
jgi:hypothetical protein